MTSFKALRLFTVQPVDWCWCGVKFMAVGPHGAISVGVEQLINARESLKDPSVKFNRGSRLSSTEPGSRICPLQNQEAVGCTVQTHRLVHRPQTVYMCSRYIYSKFKGWFRGHVCWYYNTLQGQCYKLNNKTHQQQTKEQTGHKLLRHKLVKNHTELNATAPFSVV